MLQLLRQHLLLAHRPPVLRLADVLRPLQADGGSEAGPRGAGAVIRPEGSTTTTTTTFARAAIAGTVAVSAVTVLAAAVVATATAIDTRLTALALPALCLASCHASLLACCHWNE